MIRVKQVHSARVLRYDGANNWSDSDPPEADALVTDRPGVALGIVTADCAPVLLADTDASIAAAIHAGWRGAIGGIIANAIQKMRDMGARTLNIRAAIGPCIRQQNYEVDQAFRARFTADDARFFMPGRPNHFQFDLPAFVAAQLQEMGVTQIDDCGIDTYVDAARFHSYRRAMHDGSPTGGRQISFVALPDRKETG